MEASNRRTRLVAKFRRVAHERSTKVLAGLEDLTTQPDNTELSNLIKRELHTLKGEAKMLGLSRAGKLAHAIEDRLLTALSQGTLADARDGIIEGIDLLSDLLEEAPRPDAALKVNDYLEPQPTSPSAETGNLDRHEQVLPEQGQTTPAASSPQAEASTDFVRVSTEHVQQLTDAAGELVVRHEQLERALSDIKRITLDISTGLEPIRANAGPAARAHTAKLEAFSREILSTLDRIGEEQFHNGLQLSTLQDHIRQVRLVRVGDLFANHARSVRGLARDQGKQVRVVLEGEDVTVDQQVLDSLDEPLLHLCRNAVDHALEATGERRSAGKPARSEIRLSAREVGGFVEINVIDDGRGIDHEAIAQVAVERGFITTQQAQTLTANEKLELIFRPGFSSRREVSDISGRGIGLDVVGSVLGELGGSVSVKSEQGKGTCFSLRCPVSTAFTRGLVVRGAHALYAIPSVAVSNVVSVDRQELDLGSPECSIVVDGVRTPLVCFTELLGGRRHTDQGLAKAIVVEGQGRVALLVDEVVGEREAIRRNLNPFVADIALLSGTGLIEGRRLVMFLNPQELLRLAVSRSVLSGDGWTASPRPERTRVLVVDDSELTREMLVSLLQRLDYIVDQAVDGADAFQLLSQQAPQLVITDIDMPVMDGLTLLRKIRQHPDLEQLPVIVFSTRDSQDDQQRALSGGANDYLVKAAFRADELNRTLQHHLAAGQGGERASS